MKYSLKYTHRIIALSLGITPGIIYFQTMAPTVSFWDCGEFVASAYRLGISHPPGAPLYTILARVFTMIPIVQDIANRVNFLSIIASALSVMLLYLIIIRILTIGTGSTGAWTPGLVQIGCGVLGALTLAFSHSFWFNAIEAEVYNVALFCMAAEVWLVLVWTGKVEEPGSDRYLLLIAYFIGLGTTIHFLTILIIPFIAMLIYFRKRPLTLTGLFKVTLITSALMLLIYPGLVTGLPLLVNRAGFMLVAILVGALFLMAVYSYQKGLMNINRILMITILIMVGYSTYLMIPLRSAKNPVIDMGSPDTHDRFVSYINREQYGGISVLNRVQSWKNSANTSDYQTVGEFVIRYQIQKMYIRYFMWQFAGIGRDGNDWSIRPFWGMPILLGFIGMIWQFRKNPAHAIGVMSFFLVSGLVLAIYLNQTDPQPRERDYSYVASFFAFSIWIGLGCAGIIEFFGKHIRRSPVRIALFWPRSGIVLLLVMIPLQMLLKNFSSHNRQGNYLSRDFAYNMLLSCEPDAILFTYGDNDTYSLWYLQMVEGIRPDVRVVCLSLLQTGWHIRQLRDQVPKVPMYLTEDEIKKLGFIPWERTNVLLSIPDEVAESAWAEFRQDFPAASPQPPSQIVFRLPPSHQTPHGPMLGPMQQMILNIVYANAWRRPIYFSTTMPHQAVIGELAEYLRLDGLTRRLVPFRNWEISPSLLKTRLKAVFNYRNLDNPRVCYGPDDIALLQHYRNAYIQLATYYARTRLSPESLKDTLLDMEAHLPEGIIPYTNGRLKLYSESLNIIAGIRQITDERITGLTERDVINLGQFLLDLGSPKEASILLEKTYHPEMTDRQLINLLIKSYEQRGLYQKAIVLLKNWLKMRPDDPAARQFLKRLEDRVENPRHS